jgi:arylsulfatase A-like enzyme
VKAGSVSPSLVSSVDIAPTFLELAGVQAGPTFQGVSFVPVLREPASSVRAHAFAEDHWHDYEDHGRAVTDGRYKLIRNDYFDLPGTPPADAGRSPTFQVMRRLRDEGRLSEAQRAVFIRPRPHYELYDLASDPDELENRAEDPAFRATRRRLEAALAEWAKKTDDTIPPVRTPDEFDRETGQPTAARVRPRPSKAEMFPDGR